MSDPNSFDCPFPGSETTVDTGPPTPNSIEDTHDWIIYE